LLAVADEAHIRGIPFAGHVPEAVDAATMIAAGPRSIEHVSPALPGDAGLMWAANRRPESLRDTLAAIDAASTREDADVDALRAMQRRLQGRILEWDKARLEALAGLLERYGVDVVPTLVWSQTVRPVAPGDSGVGVPLECIPRSLADRWRTNRRQYLWRLTTPTFDLHERMADRSIEFVRALHRENVRIMAGTDAFDAFVLPGPALHQELELLVKAGFTPLDALRAATSEPARFLGGGPDHCGIRPGCIADLVLLDADPLADIANTKRIQTVVLRGKVYDRAALDGILARLESSAATR
jgi:imidazolonepropionase-like amidohydrolase